MIVWYKRYEEWRDTMKRRFESPQVREKRLKLEYLQRRKSRLSSELYVVEQEIIIMKKELGE
jgi:hypothetical protein